MDDQIFKNLSPSKFDFRKFDRWWPWMGGSKNRSLGQIRHSFSSSKNGI